ncbi:cytochrome c [Sphingomonas sp. AR_OL41]|uniref:c-type cytochrome n=1 Tax=Sphingomonas sp. AR_OL41 TaxID=3042729 RepID=UPI00248057A0|nr:cytochrome c [Sphingomonas sp. AR_OL41]MDH7971914.1 cytochrome c [Sphingomonas sp. AR_OL41]
MMKESVALAMLALAAAAPIPAQQPSIPAGDPHKGRRDFQENGCYACHGTVGHGGGWQGPKLAPDPLPYEAFLAQLREPARAMPAYSREVLSDADAKDIYAYLRSIPRGKAAAQIGILNR